MRDLVDEHYPNAEQIRVAMDNVVAHDKRDLAKRAEYKVTTAKP